MLTSAQIEGAASAQQQMLRGSKAVGRAKATGCPPPPKCVTYAPRQHLNRGIGGGDINRGMSQKSRQQNSGS